MLEPKCGGIPKRLKGRAWKARRLVTRCQGSNPCSSAIVDCQDTYEKVRVFIYFLMFLIYLLFLSYQNRCFIGLPFKPVKNWTDTRVEPFHPV